MKLIFSILIIFISLNTSAQSCIDTSFIANYHIPNGRINLYDQQTNLSGEYFVTGAFNIIGSAPFFNFVSKINADGTVLFSKQLNISNTNNQNRKNLSLILKNGNFLTASSTSGYNEIPDSSLVLIKFDALGNILFSKKFFSSVGGVSPISIKEAPDGSIIILFAFLDYLNTSSRKNCILRINQVGDILWCKQYESIYVDDINSQSLSILNNRIYIKGFFIDLTYPFDVQYEHRTFLAKVDLITGELINSKSFTDFRVQDNLPSIRILLQNYASQISTINNLLVFTDRAEFASDTKFGTLSSIADTNLSFIKATFYAAPETYRQTRVKANELGEIFNYGSIYNNGNLVKSFISKFQSSGQKEREIVLTNTTNNIYQVSPVRPISILKNYFSVFNSYAQGLETYLQLYKFPSNVPLSDCYGRDTNIITTTEYNIEPVYEPFLSPASAFTFLEANLNVAVSDINLLVDKQCTIISECNFLKINPSTNTFCNLSDTVRFSVHKNIGCNKNVQWQIDTAAYSFFQVLNDTTLQIKFKQQWSGYLYAKINTCNALKDSIFINIYNRPESIALGNDTAICVNQTILLQPKIGYADYLWENGSTTPNRLIQAAGQYFIIAHDYCLNTFYDTITVRNFQLPSSVNLGNDTILCTGASLRLHAGLGFKNYTWQDGSTNENYTVSTPGDYFVLAKDSCENIYVDTIKIKYYEVRPPVNLGNDIIICTSQNFTLNAGIGYKNYRWQDGSTNSSFIAALPGKYFVQVIDSCGNSSSDTIEIKKEIPYDLSLNYTKAICIYDTVSIVLPSTFSNYFLDVTGTALIQNNILKLYPLENTVYTVNAFTPSGCAIKDTLLVKLKYCSDIIYFPSAFTPNGDGKNDYFNPLSESKPIIYELKIYNRYGQIIFESKDIKIGWNGKLTGALQNSGAYVWSCKYQFTNKPLLYKSGTILLLR